MTSRPHDALFKAVFEVRAHAVALCHAVLPAAVFAALDWTSLEHESASFVDRDLADLHGDLLFSITAVERPAKLLVYVLIEHQSRVDVDMPLRLLGYLVQVWRRERRASPGTPLPIILPIVISHAPGGWTAPRSLSDLFAPEGIPAPAALAAFLPQLHVIVEDLAALSDADIHDRMPAIVPRVTWWLLRDAREGVRLLDGLDVWGPSLDRVAHEDAHVLHLFLRYLTTVNDQLPLDVFRAKLEQTAPATAEAAMTIAEQLVRQGLEQGLGRVPIVV